MNGVRVKYYQGLDGIRYKSVLVGYDTVSKEQYIALVELESGKAWFMPIVELSRKILVGNTPTLKFRELDIGEIEPNDNTNSKPEVPYPGFTNDARLGQVQKFNTRYRGETGYNPR